MCSRRQLLSFSKALCVCQSRICSVNLFTVVCQRKIGNKKEREKEKTRKQTYQRHIRAKVDHVTDCVFLPAHTIPRAGYTQFVRWSDWEWSMQSRLSRGPTARIMSGILCFAPGGGNSLWRFILVLPPRERARRSACPFPRRGTGRMSMNFHKMYVCTSKLWINKNK